MICINDRMQIPEYVRRELSEVYLLMDHIAGRQDKSLDAALAPHDATGAMITLAELCAVPWPVPEQDRAKTLALVMTATDRLSRTAYPATGQSVAFTYLSTCADTRLISLAALRHAASYLKRRLSGEPEPATQSGEVESGMVEIPAGYQSRAATIVQFARDAFPGLESKRGWLHATIKSLMAGLLMLLVLTGAVTWDLAAGQRLLADYQWLVKHPEVMQRDLGPSQSARICPVVAAGAETGPGSLGARALACLRVLPMLETWNSRQVALTWVVHAPLSPPVGSPEYQGYVMELSRVLVTTLNYNVLPLLLGALAATAAALRTISRKITSSELAPRDLMLVWTRVALGAFLGTVIGLLIAPAVSNGLFTVASMPAPGTAISGGTETGDTVALSPAAYSFLAGFATDRIFQWLDDLIDRIFNFATPKT